MGMNKTTVHTKNPDPDGHLTTCHYATPTHQGTRPSDDVFVGDAREAVELLRMALAHEMGAIYSMVPLANIGKAIWDYTNGSDTTALERMTGCMTPHPNYTMYTTYINTCAYALAKVLLMLNQFLSPTHGTVAELRARVACEIGVARDNLLTIYTNRVFFPVVP